VNVGSLFSGIGGIELGFEEEGFNTMWCIENDTYAQTILRKRFPQATIYGDIKKIDFRAVTKADILTGGFPCQDISNAGKRAGIEGSRSSLWKYYLKAIREIRPRYALIENVSALTHRGLDVVLADLAEIGYDAEWYNISASAVGAFHRRERIFIIAYPNDSRCIYRQAKEQTTEGGEYALGKSESVCEDVSNLYEQRLERLNKREHKKGKSKKTLGWRNYWSVEPNVGRVADGVPNRVDRIKCLGNAVVPQVAQVFARAIKGYEETRW
jgi:DNA (cytosine-5)-methyltransferase 1